MTPFTVQPHSGTPQNAAARGTHKPHTPTSATTSHTPRGWRHGGGGAINALAQGRFAAQGVRVGDPLGKLAGDDRAGGIETRGAQVGGWVFGSKENHLASQIDRHIDSTTAVAGYLACNFAHDRLARGALAVVPARRGVENAGKAD